MNYKDFIENLVDDLQEEFAKRGRLIDVELVEQRKTDGIHIGIKIDDGRNIKPIIYPNGFYKSHESGGNYSHNFNRFIDQIENELRSIPLHVRLDYKQMADTITMQLVSKEHSREFLRDVVRTDVEDLAIIYRLHAVINGEKVSTVITNRILSAMEMTKEELHQLAMKKAPFNSQCIVQNLADAIGEISPEMGGIQESPLVLVSNSDKCYGASALLYPGTLERCADIMNGDFFVLPSSVHECLLCADNDSLSLRDLKSVVKDVNDTVLDTEELLSYNVYHYDHKDKIFEIADKFYERKMAMGKCSVLNNLKSKQDEMEFGRHIIRNQDSGIRHGREQSL